MSRLLLAALLAAFMQPVLAVDSASATAIVPTVNAPAATPTLLPVHPLLPDDVFGSQLFSGSFARQGATQFNPDYSLAIGDRIHVRIWGAFEFDNTLVLDAQGNIFLPHVGPIKLAGIANRDLQQALDVAMRKVFRANVFSYASLADAQPVRIFVGGFVRRPGLYDGNSMNSLLHYLDQAEGIDSERGSFLRVEVKRGEQVRAVFNLYDFLLAGRLPLLQLADGDVIFVGPRLNMVSVRGLALNPQRFEFSSERLALSAMTSLARPLAEATHMRVIRNTGAVRNISYYALAKMPDIALVNGDEVEFTADKRPGTITVRVEGEHSGQQEHVLPYGATYGDLMRGVRLGQRAQAGSIQLFRKSVRMRQKQMLDAALVNFESSVLTARSATSDEASLRKEEAELLLKWVARARTLEPSGQVVIAGSAHLADMPLENGDVFRIPGRDSLVLVNGEVLFPTALAWRDADSAGDYIAKAGGYSQKADSSRVVIVRVDGLVDQGGRERVQPGDQILVLPKVDTKSLQIAKDLTQILFQVAVTAKVALGL